MKLKIFAYTLVAALAVFVGFGIAGEIKTERVYEQAVAHMYAAEYESAIEQLILVNDGEIEERDFHLSGEYDEIEAKSYKDSAVLLAYALAKVSYEEENSMGYIKAYVDFIPDGYDQTLYEEIIAFKQNFEIEYEAYQYERSQERKAEEAERLNKSASNSGKNNRSTYKTSNGTGKEPYGINDYDTPEDFYESNRDEFWDYEEAQRYYNRYHENP